MSSISRDRLEQEYKRLLGEETIPLREVLTAIVESGDGIVLADREGKIQYVNPAYEEMTGYLEHELIGKTPAMVSSGLYSKKYYDTMWERLKIGEVFQAEFINRRKTGELYYQAETIAPVKDAKGAVVGFVSNGRDVTGEKYYEKKLQLMGTMSSSFLGRLRDPLRRIELAALNLRTYAEEQKNKKVYDDLDAVYSTSRQMEQMLDALYEFLNPSFTKDISANIKDVLSHALKIVEPEFSKLGVTFTTEFEEPLPLSNIFERQWRFVLVELLHHYAAIAIGQKGELSVIKVKVRSPNSSLIVTIEGGKGMPINSHSPADELFGCVWVDGVDLKFTLMELAIADAKGIVHYELIDGFCKTTLIIPRDSTYLP